MENKNNRPDYRCKAIEAMTEGWQIVQDVSKGTLHMRALGKTYLPQFPAESKEAYEDRRKGAVFFNAYTRTINGLVGMVFKKNPVLTDDVPEIIRGNKDKGAEGHIENIDLSGNHLDVFAKEVFKDAFEGHSFILVDMQPKLTPEATLADEIKAGRRPYWVKYKACEVVNFRSVMINGERVIGQITFEEKSTAAAGEYGEEEVVMYRTFRLLPFAIAGSPEMEYRVAWELKQKIKGENGEDTFIERGAGEVSQPRIPVAVVYGRKTGFLTSQPVLLDLALTNIKYYQKRSDYDHTLHLAGIPILVGKGIPDDFNMQVVSSEYMLRVPAPDGDMKYVEVSGNSLKAAREDMQDVRSEMAALGLSVLAARQEGEATATESLIDFTQESSELATMARSLSDALELCMGFHARYLNLESGGSISLGCDFNTLTLTTAQLTLYSSMQKDGQLTLQTLWSLMKRADALPEDFNEQTEMKLLEEKEQKSQEAQAELAKLNQPAQSKEEPPANPDEGIKK